MRKTALFVLWALPLAVLSMPAVAGNPEVLGERLETAQTVSLAKLLADPESYVDREVRVRGTVADVCPRMGCWIDIAKGERTIRFKVNDGEIVFKPEMRGKKVVAEGVLQRMELDRDEAVAYARHMAEESGADFDPASVTGPMTIYRIQGVGAVVK